MGVNNITVDTFSHTYNTKRENANAIFTIEKVDKSNDLVDTSNHLKINDAEYYISNSVTLSEAQGNLTRNLRAVTHNRKGKEKLRTLATGILSKQY